MGTVADFGSTRVYCLRPDRWDNLPEAVKAQPGLYNNILTFSAGPRVSGYGMRCALWVTDGELVVCRAQSCIGVKFSIIEIKMFMFILVTNFKFAECDKVGKANVYVRYRLSVDRLIQVC